MNSAFEIPLEVTYASSASLICSSNLNEIGEIIKSLRYEVSFIVLLQLVFQYAV